MALVTQNMQDCVYVGYNKDKLSQIQLISILPASSAVYLSSTKLVINKKIETFCYIYIYIKSKIYHAFFLFCFSAFTLFELEIKTSNIA